MVVNHKLKEIFQISFPHHEVYAFDENWDNNSHDCQIPFGSLPYHFRNNDTDFPDRKKIICTPKKNLNYILIKNSNVGYRGKASIQLKVNQNR